MNEINWNAWDKVANNLMFAKYYFAKTMAKNPHQYTLRKEWNDADFVEAVKYIREYGYADWFFGKKYIDLNVNDRKYWTMGEEINKDGKPWTILINSKPQLQISPYDFISTKYDKLFKGADDLKENRDVMDLIDWKPGETVLDIGCGTGLFLEYNQVPAKDYLGIDCSYGMLKEFSRRHGIYVTILTKFEDFYFPRKFDKIVSLFGSFSYIKKDYLTKVIHLLKPGGQAFLMVYKPDYHPSTYEKTDVEFVHEKYDIGDFMGIDVANDMMYSFELIDMGNYIMAMYIKEDDK